MKLLPTDGAADDLFGRSVSVSGNVALVGSRSDDDNGDFSGSAYVFRFNGSTWVQEAKLTASDGVEGDGFGLSVSVSGELALIGASFVDDNGLNSGAAYVFRYDGGSWIEEQKLLASDGLNIDMFGDSVSLSGNTAVVGAHNRGRAYVFRYDGNTWVEEFKLSSPDCPATDEFGASVSIFGDTILVGANGDDENGFHSGAAFLFGRPASAVRVPSLSLFGIAILSGVVGVAGWRKFLT